MRELTEKQKYEIIHGVRCASCHMRHDDKRVDIVCSPLKFLQSETRAERDRLVNEKLVLEKKIETLNKRLVSIDEAYCVLEKL